MKNPVVDRRAAHEEAMSRGRIKSGRFWKAPRDRFKSVVKSKEHRVDAKRRMEVWKLSQFLFLFYSGPPLLVREHCSLFFNHLAVDCCCQQETQTKAMITLDRCCFANLFCLVLTVDAEDDDEALDELIGLMRDSEVGGLEEGALDNNDKEEEGLVEDSGVQAEVDMFMAKGGYQVTYIGSLSVRNNFLLIN